VPVGLEGDQLALLQTIAAGLAVGGSCSNW
jgi:hypothetical protein